MLKLNLQFFAEGGEASPAGENNLPASIPEKARKNYQKAMQRAGKAAVPQGDSSKAVPEGVGKKQEGKAVAGQPEGDSVPAQNHVPYAELIKGEEYKAEHDAFMSKVIGERIARYKGVEEQNGKMRAILETVGGKYGVDVTGENFLSELAAKVEADASYYEQYAAEHDIPADEAKRMLQLERRVKQQEMERIREQKLQADRQKILQLQRNAEKTKEQFPGFDLEKELADERFRRLCSVNNGDTTAAYMACHWNEVLTANAQQALSKAAQQTAQSVAANRARPEENGLAGTGTTVSEPDFSKMGLKEIRAYAQEQRRLLAKRNRQGGY